MLAGRRILAGLIATLLAVALGGAATAAARVATPQRLSAGEGRGLVVVRWHGPAGLQQVRFRVDAGRWHRRSTRRHRLRLRAVAAASRYQFKVRVCAGGECSAYSRLLSVRGPGGATSPDPGAGETSPPGGATSSGGPPASGAPVISELPAPEPGPEPGTPPATPPPGTPPPGPPGEPPPAGTSPQVGGCPVFPADNAWNQDVSSLPVDPRSDAYVAAISAAGDTDLHPDFGGQGQYGIPFTVVPQDQPPVPIAYTEFGDQSDPGPFPIPSNAPVEGGSDRHVLVVQRGACRLYELYHAQRSDNGWDAGSGTAWDLGSNALRPVGWTSADAAGLAILPGLARYDEVAAGGIHHALRFTVEETQSGYIHPATHYASASDDPNLPPMGLRLRMKSSYDISQFHGEARVILEALKRYGMIVADNGTSWYITGAADPRWDDDDLDQLKGVPGSAFEAVQTGPIEHGSG